MPKKSSSGAPKKARWTPAEKKAVHGAPKKAHRGQGGPKSAPAGRTARPASASSSHVGGREWRAPRDERPSLQPGTSPRTDRPSYNRDDRAPRSDRPSYNRDDRAPAQRPSELQPGRPRPA